MSTQDEGHSEHDILSIDETLDENVGDWKPFEDISASDMFTITFTAGTTYEE